jgi:hypothetical protein
MSTETYEMWPPAPRHQVLFLGSPCAPNGCECRRDRDAVPMDGLPPGYTGGLEAHQDGMRFTLQQCYNAGLNGEPLPFEYLNMAEQYRDMFLPPHQITLRAIRSWYMFGAKEAELLFGPATYEMWPEAPEGHDRFSGNVHEPDGDCRCHTTTMTPLFFDEGVTIDDPGPIAALADWARDWLNSPSVFEREDSESLWISVDEAEAIRPQAPTFAAWRGDRWMVPEWTRNEPGQFVPPQNS